MLFPNNKCPMLFLWLLLLAGQGLANTISIIEGQEKYFLKPQLSYWIPSDSLGNTDSSIEDISSMPFKPYREYTSYFKGKLWLRFQIDFTQGADTVYLVSERNNIFCDFQLFQQNRQGQWITEKSNYHEAKIRDDDPLGKVVFKIPPTSEVRTIYLGLNARAWISPELLVLTQKGLKKYTSQVFRATLFYTGFVLFVLFSALLVTIFFRIKLALLFAFYVFCTALISLFELTVFFIPKQPEFIYTISLYLFPLFILSFMWYSKSFLQLKKRPKWSRQVYHGLIIGLIIYFFSAAFISEYGLIDNIISSLLGYGSAAMFFYLVFHSWKSNPPIRWFMTGTSIVVLTFLLIDLHDRNIIFLPDAFEWLYFLIVLELIFVSIGTLLAVKQKRKEFVQTSNENIRLKDRLEHLQKEVKQSKSAFQQLVNRKTTTPLTAPPAYYDHPLSARELQVVQLLARDFTNQEISDHLHLSRNTIKTHLKNIYQKLDTHNRKEAVQKAKAYGLL